MSRRDTGTDDPRVRVRPTKGSRPRSKQRPDYTEAPVGQVVGIDRGRFTVALADRTRIQCIKARELGRGSVVMGDRVNLTGDLTGRPGSLGRIVNILEREHVLRRSLEEAADDKGEKIIVVNADLLVIVTAAADPVPRLGMVERCLVAAQEAGIGAILCMTKSDLIDPAEFVGQFDGFELDTVITRVTDEGDQGLQHLRDTLRGRFSVLVGHSGVGKSTLINALVPDADRAVGVVNQATGKGRHTSTSAIAFELPEGGWVVDTPGVRSFGLSHTSVDDVLAVYPGLSEAVTYCLPHCLHREEEPSCALDEWILQRGVFAETPLPTGGPEQEQRRDLVERARKLLVAVGNTDND